MNTCTLPDSEDLKDIVLLFELGGETTRVRRLICSEIMD